MCLCGETFEVEEAVRLRSRKCPIRQNIGRPQLQLQDTSASPGYLERCINGTHGISTSQLSHKTYSSVHVSNVFFSMPDPKSVHSFFFFFYCLSAILSVEQFLTNLFLCSRLECRRNSCFVFLGLSLFLFLHLSGVVGCRAGGTMGCTVAAGSVG